MLSSSISRSRLVGALSFTCEANIIPTKLATKLLSAVKVFFVSAPPVGFSGYRRFGRYFF
jgi:hypothetical protein